ncbi:MAG: sulfotransferase [Phycisphaeraceae bacterium]|nr:sulfotransferase [Phycisphaeraceae bacterium]
MRRQVRRPGGDSGRRAIAVQSALRDAERLLAIGDHAGAEAILNQARRSAREDARVLLLLGQIATRRGWFDRAIEHFESAIALAGDHQVPTLLLIQALARAGRLDDAMARADRARGRWPESPEIRLALADTHERAGRLDEAAAAAAAARALAPDDPSILLLSARIALAQRDAPAAVGWIEPLTARSDLPEGMRRAVLFTLGGALDRIDRIDDAFSAWERANLLQTQPFDEQRVRRRIDAIIEVFDREGFDQIPASEATSALPVFIVGMPRSGSTLVEQIIHAHPSAVGAGELTDFNETIAALSPARAPAGGPPPASGAYPATVRTLDCRAMTRLAMRHLERLRRHHAAAERLVDKNLLSFYHLGLIARLFPNATLIESRRHPLDVGFSCFSNDLPTVGFPWSSRLHDIGVFHRQHERLMAHWRELLGPRLLTVPYESLVEAPEPWSRRIIDHCGLPWSDACLSPHRAQRAVTTLSYDQVRQPVYTSSVGRAERRYGAHLGPLRAALGDLRTG